MQSICGPIMVKYFIPWGGEAYGMSTVAWSCKLRQKNHTLFIELSMLLLFCSIFECDFSELQKEFLYVEDECTTVSLKVTYMWLNRC